MYLALIIFLVCCAVGGLVFVKSRAAGTGFVPASSLMQQRRAPTTADPKPAVARRDYRAVSIKCHHGACDAARRIAGRRGLPHQIPRLPLSGCDPETCACTYKNHPDRRTYDDRRSPYGGFQSAQHALNNERRAGERREDAASDDLENFKISYS